MSVLTVVRSVVMKKIINSVDSSEKEAPIPQDEDLLQIISFEDITNVCDRPSLLFHDFDRKKIEGSQ